MNAGPTITSLRVRDSRDDDVPALAGLYAPWVLQGLASFELEPPDALEFGRRRNRVLEGGYPYLVAEDSGSGAVLGYAYAGPTERGRPTASPSRTRSTSPRRLSVAASGRPCWAP